MEPFNLSMSQSFELERSLRVIEACNDIDELKKVCKTLAQAWYNQKAATQWVMKNNLSSPPTVTKL